MKRAKMLMICCWMVLILGILGIVYVSQDLSEHFTGNEFLAVSILIYLPLLVVAIVALQKVSRETA